jgi:hypothetical protein
MAAATCIRLVRSSFAASMPKPYSALGFAQFSVKAAVIAATASAQGFVVAELSK